MQIYRVCVNYEKHVTDWTMCNTIYIKPQHIVENDQR